MGRNDAGRRDEPRQPADAERAAVLYLLYNPGRHKTFLAQSTEILGRAGVENIIMLDNGSDEPGVAAWAATLPGVEVWRSDTNLMFAQGCNQLVRLTNAETLVFLNQDTVVEAGVLGALASLTEDSCVTYAQVFPWSDGPVVPQLTRNGAFMWVSAHSGRSTTNVVSGGAFAIHRDTIEHRLGGTLFDPRIPHYGEDIHLSLRLERTGVQIRTWTASPVFHDSSPSTGSATRDFRRAIKIQRNTLRAFLFDLGSFEFTKRVPFLLKGAWEKADVDGRATLLRRLGLVTATVIALLGCWLPPKQFPAEPIYRWTNPP